MKKMKIRMQLRAQERVVEKRLFKVEAGVGPTCGEFGL
jgi:hypothetical protein